MSHDRYPIDPAFPKLHEALDPERMAVILREELEDLLGETGGAIRECVPEYIRYKPGVSCIIGYCLHVSPNGNESRVVQRVHGRLLNGGRDEEEYRKASKTHTAHPAWGPPAVYSEALGMILSFFPNDRSLRGLRFVLDPDKLKRIAQGSLHDLVSEPWWIRGRRSKIEILSYKPERHCVTRCILGLRNVDTGEKREIRVIGKILGMDDGKRIYDANRNLRDLCERNGEDPVIPEPLAFDPEFSLFFQEEVAGTHPLPGSIDRGEWYRVLREVAGRLKCLHRLSFGGASNGKDPDPFDELDRSARHAADVIQEDGKMLLEQLEDLGNAGSSLDDIPAGTIHGDFHLRQVLVTESGPRILDIDAFRRSHFVEDVANLTAHLHELRLEKILSDEERVEAEGEILRGYYPDGEFDEIEPAYRWHLKAALLRLALSRLKYLPNNWRSEMEYFLREAGNLELVR